MAARSRRGPRSRSYWRIAAGLTTACAAFAACTIVAAATELPLQRVILSNSGLAQFTYSGTAAAGDKLELSVRLDQVDDILKSLTVFDREGALGAVSLPGKAPLQELFRDLPFGPDAINSLANLLNALVGSEIEIDGHVKARGRVFPVEEERTRLPDNGGEITRHRLTLLTDKGLVQAVLEDLSALRFVDPQTDAQVSRALSGLAQNRAKDRRSITIDLLGQGSRPVGFSYVVAAPVWKAAYRLVLPKEGGGARLQGWAVVENLTGGDWQDVELSLVSGNPVALKQPLYTAFYVDRPEIPVAASVRLMPRKGGGRRPADAARRACAFANCAAAVRERWRRGERRSRCAHGRGGPAAGGSDRPRGERRRVRGSFDPGAVPVSHQSVARGRLDHDAALRRPQCSGNAHLALSAADQCASSARRRAPAQRWR
jgi:hypothetical protein